MINLEEFNEAYDEAETNDEFSAIPDGTYQVFIDEICLKETKETMLPMIAWKFKVISGASEGRIVFKNSVINDNTISYVKTDISICGLVLDKFSNIERHLVELLNVQLEIKLATKKDKKGEPRQNVWIQKKISVNGSDTVNEDDIPF